MTWITHTVDTNQKSQSIILIQHRQLMFHFNLLVIILNYP